MTPRAMASPGLSARSQQRPYSLQIIRTGVAALPVDGAAIGMAKAPVERAQPRPAVRTASLMCIAWSSLCFAVPAIPDNGFCSLGSLFCLGRTANRPGRRADATLNAGGRSFRRREHTGGLANEAYYYSRCGGRICRACIQCSGASRLPQGRACRRHCRPFRRPWRRRRRGGLRLRHPQEPRATRAPQRYEYGPQRLSRPALLSEQQVELKEKLGTSCRAFLSDLLAYPVGDLLFRRRAIGNGEPDADLLCCLGLKRRPFRARN